MGQVADWLEQERQRKYHPVSDLFPLMEGPEFEELKTDIKANGLHEAIWLHPDGSIIDGRNRHRACLDIEVRPEFRTWDNSNSLVTFVVSMNLRRRHLTTSQRAMIATDILPMLEAEAAQRQKELAGTRPHLNADLPQKIEEGHACESVQQAAQILQTNRQYVSDAKVIRKKAPDLAEQVRIGEKTIPEAKREMTKRAREPKPRLAPAAKSPILIVAHAEHIPQVESESIDLIITSPPYNLGGGNWPMGGGGRMPRNDGVGFPDAMPEDKYQKWQLDCLAEMYRVAKLGASLFYNHKVRHENGTVIHPIDWLKDKHNPWAIRQEIIWDRGSTHNHSPTLFWPEDERVYWMTKGKPTLPNHPIGLSSVWHFHGPIAGTWHPAPFPEELPHKCIEAIGHDGIVVLDPFAGSCTTLRVALEYGYDAIGVDISREYLEQAAEENGWILTNDN